jgi:neutral ceramidase
LEPTIKNSTLSIGFGQVDVTPPIGDKICGALEPRVSIGTTDPLMSNALVATDGDKRIAIVGVDIVGLPRVIVDKALGEIQKRTGIDHDAIIISCSHTHSGPYTTGPFFIDAQDPDYLGSLPKQIAKSVEIASQALQPATMHIGRSLVHRGLHYRLALCKDGKAFNSWMGDALNDLATCPQIIGAAGPIDPELWVLRFDDLKGKTIGIFFNFSVHTNSHFGVTWSADYPGVVAEYMREKYGPQVITVYTPGACANINPLYGGERWREGAVIFAEAAIAAANRAVKIEGPIVVDAIRRDVAVAKRDPASQPEGAIQRLNWGGGRHYEEVFEPMLEYVAGLPDTWLAPVNTARLGPFAVATNPGELFVEHGFTIKKLSPFPHTVVAELTNDWTWYMPTREAFQQQVYETLVGANQISLEGVETLVDMAVDLLHTLWRR